MRFFCPACGTVHTLDDNTIPSGGTTVECSKCGFAIKVKPPKRSNGSQAVAATIPQMTQAQEPLAESGTQQSIASATEDDLNDDSWLDETTDPGDYDKQADAPDESIQQKQDDDSLADELLEQDNDAGRTDAGQAEHRKPGHKKTKKKTKPLGDVSISIPYAGCGRSGDKFRLRDLLFALQAPLDFRKTISAAAGVFVGGLLLMAVTWLSMQINSRIAAIAGLIVGSVIYFACMFIGLAVAIRLSDREMIHGGRLDLAEATGFVKQRLFDVVAFPFSFVVAILFLGVGIGIFHLIARIPYAGPLVYGLTFGVVIVSAILAVGLGVVLVLSAFSYIPALEGRGVMPAAKYLWNLIKAKPGRYFLNLLISALVTAVLIWLFSFVIHWAFSFIGFVDSLAGGGQYSQILLSAPGGLFPLWALLFDTGLGVGKGFGWQFTIAGWLVFVYMLALLSIVQGFVMTYFHSAGVVNYHLLTQDEEQQRN